MVKITDLYLGRFNQPDSIVPGAGDPASFDRYHYSRNNPVRYIDPTGHRSCTPEEAATGDETCDQNSSNTEDESEPTITLADIQNNVTLSDPGEKLYKLFLEFLAEPGWWRKYYGDADPFAIFIAILLSREGSAWKNDDWFGSDPNNGGALFKEAAVRWFWAYRNDSSITSRSGAVNTERDQMYAMLNWFSEGMQSDNAVTLDLLASSTYENGFNSAFIGITNEIRNPSNPTWADGSDGMWSWANDWLYTSEGQALLPDNNVYNFGNFYILNGAQVNLLHPHKCPGGNAPCTD